MSDTTIWKVKRGDYHRRLGIDLTSLTTTGATGVVMRMQSQQGGAVVTRAGVIDSATRVSCQFVPPELDTPGVYNLETELTYADGTETAPTEGYVTVVIGPKLG